MSHYNELHDGKLTQGDQESVSELVTSGGVTINIFCNGDRDPDKFDPAAAAKLPNGARILARVLVDDTWLWLAERVRDTGPEFVVWQSNAESPGDTYWGRYFPKGDDRRSEKKAMTAARRNLLDRIHLGVARAADGNSI